MASWTWLDGVSGDWSEAGDWYGGTVPKAGADISIGVASRLGPSFAPVTIKAGEQVAVGALTIGPDAVLNVTGTLTVSGLLSAASGGAAVPLTLLGGTGTLVLEDALASGSVIGGTGTIEPGPGFDNTGTITTALTGGVPGSTLTLDIQDFRNDGAFVSSGGQMVVSAGLDNLAGGTLSGGTYSTVGGTLLLGDGPVRVDAATIDLIANSNNGAQPLLAGWDAATGQYVNLQDTLGTIAAGGTLFVSGSGGGPWVPSGSTAFSTQGALLVQGALESHAATLSAGGGLTIAGGGLLSGDGLVQGDIVNDGTIVAGLPDRFFNAPYGGVVEGSVTLTLTGAVTGSGTLAVGSGSSSLDYYTNFPIWTSSLELQGPTAETVAFQDATGRLILDDPASFTGTISGFTSQAQSFWHRGVLMHDLLTDSIVLRGIDAASVTDHTYTSDATGGTLTLWDNGTALASLYFAGGLEASNFTVGAARDMWGDPVANEVLITDPPTPSTLTDPPCFVRGTRIQTPRGPVAVEDLAEGELVVTASGEAVRIVWIGHRRVRCALHPAPEKVRPVRIRAGAFGDGLPACDLWLSPDHAVFAEDVLIPARLLVDDGGVTQVEVVEVEYFHVELPRHDVILAEGLPVESYLDTGNRAMFANGAAFLILHPDFGADRRDLPEACAPFVVRGEALERVRARLRGVRQKTPAAA